MLTAAGLAGAMLAGRSRPAAALSGAALMAASALTRFGVFEAGWALFPGPEVHRRAATRTPPRTGRTSRLTACGQRQDSRGLAAVIVASRNVWPRVAAPAGSPLAAMRSGVRTGMLEPVMWLSRRQREGRSGKEP